MAELLAALAVFIASHVLAAYKPFRFDLSARIGERGFLIGYSVVSLVLLVWLFAAFTEAPTVPLWPLADWMRWVPLSLMPFACILAVAGLTSPNPFSIGAGSAGFDPQRPGIVSVSRHPVIWALILWSGSHMVPNGDLKSLILFGLLTGLGLYGPPSLDAKRRTGLGEAEWQNLSRHTANLPFATRRAIDWKGIGGRRVLGGLLLYGALLAVHPWLFGADPLP